MITKPTLYKKNSDNTIQIWYQEIDGQQYRTISGKINGKHVVSKWTVATGKNTGKTNAVVPEDQAIKESEADYTKKLKSGYFHSVNDINSFDKFKPMLAEKFEDYEDSAHESVWYSQPKLDGIRCISRSDGLWTRNGEAISTAPHILAAMEEIHDSSAGLIFDGELYTHSLKRDFEELSSTVKNVEKADNFIEYWLYDVVRDGRDDSPYEERLQLLHSIWSNYPSKFLIITPTQKISDAGHMDYAFDKYLENGYEGQILRRGDAIYKNKRSKYLLKRKNFSDAEFKIVSFQEGIGNKSGSAATIEIELPNGVTCKATLKGDYTYRKYLWKNKDKLIGKYATVKYFGITKDGRLRFPTVKAIHETDRW